MTEAEWLACDDPAAMLATVSGRASERKLRLVVVACCREVATASWPLKLRWVLETAEGFADGLVDPIQATAAWSTARQHALGPLVRSKWGDAAAALEARMLLVSDAVAVGGPLTSDGLHTFHCDPVLRRVGPVLLRCVWPTPGGPGPMPDEWRTSTAVALAQGIYADHAFDRLPILADALEDAGCESTEMLTHCRGDGPHVRGCWVVDSVLGKG